MDYKGKNQEVLSYCSICGRCFSQEEINFIKNEDKRTILHVTCAKCNASTLLVLSENQKGMMALGMLTDLDKEEVEEKIGGRAISSDEIIETYKILNRD